MKFHGWNLFVMIMMAVCGRMELVAKLWKSLSQEERDAWNERAKRMKSGPGKKRLLTGYNCFVRVQFKELEGSPREKMKRIGELWRGMSVEERKQWDP